MIFVDIASIVVKAGDGGDGAVSFRHEPYVDRGGPNGGDGGRGGNVVFKSALNLNTLSDFRHTKQLKAEHGGKGARANRHGANGQDLIVKVPVGTVVMQGDAIIADLNEPEMEKIVAKGGDGGFGNAHFTSSTRQAPNFAENGEPGEEYEFTLEVKVIADVGLVGLPNAGKSTLLSVVSNARPEIANYPFTTLIPNLGVADVGEQSLLIADIPGLIEGASEGRGLGDDFLRHVERTAVLIHLIDVYSNDIAKDYQTIVNELKSYKVDLTDRPIFVALTKVEGVDQDIINDQMLQISKVAGNIEIYAISSVAKQGVETLLADVYQAVSEYRIVEEDVDDEGKVVKLEDEQLSWKIDEIEGGLRITGSKIEKFAKRTDFTNPEAVHRLRDIMKKMGITRELMRRQLDQDTEIQFGRAGNYRIKF